MSSEQFPNPESQERLVEVTRVSTVFKNAETLELIAERLLREGAISGFTVEPITGGYIYEGKQVTEAQFKLNILLESEETKETVIEAMRSEISKHWDVPAITEEKVTVNESLLKFVERAKIEHERYKKERKKSLALALSAALSFSGMLGTGVSMYGEKRARDAAQTERVESEKRMRELNDQLGPVIQNIQGKIARGESFEEVPTDMGAGGHFEEFSELQKIMREAEHEMRKIVEADK